MIVRDVLIVGSGPAGLAAAIAARQAGLDYQLLERGVLTNSIYRFPTHMIFFTTPELLEIGNLPFVTPYEKPTRREALRYYRRVADTYRLQMAFDENVVGIAREPVGANGGFLAVETRSGRGVRRLLHARTVVLAIGTFDHPNRIAVDGEDLPHVSHYYQEAHPHYRRDVVVVGAKNSAAEAALDLYRAGARVTMVHRGTALNPAIKYWVRPDLENRIKEGSIAVRFESAVVEIRPTSVLVERAGVREELAADAVFLLTGYHGDTELLVRSGVRVDPETCVPVCDPETFETNVDGLYLAGSIVAGKLSGKVFIENGRFHGEAVISAIARRLGKGAAPPRLPTGKAATEG